MTLNLRQKHSEVTVLNALVAHAHAISMELLVSDILASSWRAIGMVIGTIHGILRWSQIGGGGSRRRIEIYGRLPRTDATAGPDVSSLFSEPVVAQ